MGSVSGMIDTTLTGAVSLTSTGVSTKPRVGHRAQAPFSPQLLLGLLLCPVLLLLLAPRVMATPERPPQTPVPSLASTNQPSSSSPTVAPPPPPPPPPPWDGPAAGLESDGRGGQRIVVDGTVTPPIFLSLNPFFGNWSVFRYEVGLAVGAGVNLLEVCLNEDTADTAAATVAAELQTAGYTGYIIVRIGMYAAVPTTPAVLQGTATGAKVECTAATCSATLHTLSAEWVAAKVAVLRTLLPKLNARFPGKLAGVRPTYLNGGEWFYVMTRFNTSTHDWYYGDYSSDANTSFCEWAGLPASLRPRCTVPDVRTRWTPTLGNTFVGGDGAEGSLSVYYARFLAHRVATTITALAAEIKAVSGGRLITMFFYGYLFELGSDYCNGHDAMSTLLASPDIDVLGAPYSYGRARTLAVGFSPHGPADAAAVSRKLFVHEDDTRTVLCPANDPTETGLRLTNLSDSLAVIRRNGLTAVLRGNGLYYFDLWGQGWFGNPTRVAESTAIWAAIGSVLRVASAVNASGPTPFAPQVSVFTSELTPSHMTVSDNYGPKDGEGFPNDLVADAFTRTAVDDLTQLGAPIRLHLATDLESDAFDSTAVRLAIFTNAFSLGNATRTAIKAKLMARGATVLFIHASGYVDADTLDADPTSIADLTGISVAEGIGAIPLVTRITSGDAGVPIGTTFGVATAVSPWFHVVDATSLALGQYDPPETGNLTSLAAKQFPTHRVVWSGAPGGRDLFRAVASTTAGLTLWSNVTTDVVEAAGNTLMVFTTTVSGPRAVSLHSTVTNLVRVSADGDVAVCARCAGFDTTLDAREVYVWRWD
eukprot:m.333209 g.333209  ORF g.333209 m.333209 type:complete len:819 (-) comp27738_c0_seq1:85-2541(-)